MATSEMERARGARRERISASPRFVNGKFANIHPLVPEATRAGAMPSVLEFFRGRPGKRPLAPLPAHDPRHTLRTAPQSGLRATWLGHSSLLIELDSLRFLTDPVWGERLSPVPFVAPRRFQPVPMAVEALPPLDAVLISHDHFDHLDHPTIQRLVRASAAPFVTALGVGAHLERWGVPPGRVRELDWWEELTLGDVRITATPSQHFSGRGLGANATAWTSFSVRGPRHSFFFSGDTGLTSQFHEVRARLGRFDLVMLEVGAYHPAWGDIHLGPAHALTALDWLGGGAFLPVHWGTFDLALHPWDEPAEELYARAPSRDVQLLMPELGLPVEPGAEQRLLPSPWWRSISALEGRVPVQPEPEPGAPVPELAQPID